jgi:hypothetical protein
MTPTADSLQGFRNRIINGDMRIDQRNAGASVATSALYPVDRTRLSFSGGGVLTGQRSTTAPTGFTNSLFITASTADASVAAGDFYGVQQLIEGFNAADLAFGSAGASTVTISFWVRSSLTGTYCVAITNAANARSYVAEYSISAADTWEKKSVTIAGDTSGTWTTDNTSWGRVRFGLGGGASSQTTAGSWAAGNFFLTSNQTNWIGTLDATWFVTGVQLEAGSTATPFERRPYGTEFMLCQRYYYKIKAENGDCIFGSGYNATTTEARIATPLPVEMRISPTALEQTGTAADYRVLHGTTNTTLSSVPAIGSSGGGGLQQTNATVASGLTAGQGSLLRAASASAYLAWSAEL